MSLFEAFHFVLPDDYDYLTACACRCCCCCLRSQRHFMQEEDVTCRASRQCARTSHPAPSFLLLLQICIALRTFAGRISLSARALATKGKNHADWEEAVCRRLLLMSLAIYTYLCACLPRWLVSCMHCGPGLMSCCALHARLRREELSEVFVCVCECVRVCRVCLVCVRVVSAVSRTGTFIRYAQACCCWSAGEIWKRNEALARESACDDTT